MIHQRFRITIEDSRMSKKKITVALGGGGARGLAHLGVIDALTEQGFEIERIVGISIGSLVGGMVAFHDSIDHVRSRALNYLTSAKFQKHQQTLFGASGSSPGDETRGIFSWYYQIQEYMRANRIFHRVISQPGMLHGVLLQDVMDHLLPDDDLSEARTPLTIVAADLLSGHVVMLEKGSLRQAVRGSSALPGIFPPVEFDDMLLCDSGNFLTLPTRIASSYPANFVLGVEISAAVKPLQQVNTALEAWIRVDEIGEDYWRKQVRSAADFVLQPPVAHVEWFNFSAAAKVMEIGKQAAYRAMDQIEAAWQKRNDNNGD